MATNIAHKFYNPNGTINTAAAMQAGLDARTDALRSFKESFIGLMTSCLKLNNLKETIRTIRTSTIIL